MKRKDAASSATFVRPMKTADVASYMGLSTCTILRMVRDGRIPAKKVSNEYYYDPRQIAKLCGIEP